MAQSGRVSAAYCRGARAALTLLYEAVLKQPGKVCDLPRMKRPQQLPVVLPALAVRPGSREEVARLLKVVDNLKRRALWMPAYPAGLRVGEVVRLKVSDIDSTRMQIRVTAGKGAKDRYTLLSETALAVLRDYFRAYKPKEWLFPGADTLVRAVSRKDFQTRENAGRHNQASELNSRTKRYGKRANLK